tara:strand:+ start:1006 stop:1395 length:390 start_codon:yes stop_codon:yes gene_type:complete
MSNNQIKYISLIIKVIDLENGNLLNNYILNKRINFNIRKKNTNQHEIIIEQNDKTFNLNNILIHSYEKMIIIPYEEYKNMLDLFYNNSSQLVNYNNNYFILQIRPNLVFNTNNTNVLKIQNTFSNIITT